MNSVELIDLKVYETGKSSKTICATEQFRVNLSLII